MKETERYIERAMLIESVAKELGYESSYNTIKTSISIGDYDFDLKTYIQPFTFKIDVEIDVSDWDRIPNGECLGAMNKAYKIAYEKGERVVEICNTNLNLNKN